MTEVAVIDNGCEDIAGKIASGIDEYGGQSNSILIRNIRSFNELTGKKPDVLVLSEDAVKTVQAQGMRIACGILLLPGDVEDDSFDAECIVTYGMSPKNTITLSSISEESCVLALQRELVTTSGDVLERQEIMIKGGLRPTCLLAVTGALLILGQKITDIIQ